MFIDHILQKILFNDKNDDRQKLEYFKILYCNTKYYRDKIFIYIEFLRAKMDMQSKL